MAAMQSAPREPAGGPPTPWLAAAADEVEFAFASLWTTGDDTSLDRLIRIHALRRGARGEWERFDRSCAADRSCATEDPADLGNDAIAPALAWRDFELFLGGRTVVVVS